MRKVNDGNEKRDLARTRRQILDAAAAEFAEHGLSGGRMDRIAAQAGVSKAMIYYAFSNKEALHLAVLEELFVEKTREVDALVEDAVTPVADLIRIVTTYFDAFFSRQDYARIMVGDLLHGAGTLRALQKKRPDLFAVFDRFSRVVAEYIASQGIKRLDPDKSVMMIILLLSALACTSSQVDLVRPKGSAAFRELSDPEKWKAFLAEIMRKVLQPA